MSEHAWIAIVVIWAMSMLCGLVAYLYGTRYHDDEVTEAERAVERRVREMRREIEQDRLRDAGQRLARAVNTFVTEPSASVTCRYCGKVHAYNENCANCGAPR